MDEEQVENNEVEITEIKTVNEELVEKEEKLQKTTGLNLEKLEMEIRRGYRTVEFEGKEYHIYLPSVKDDEAISRYKSKLSTELLMDKDTKLKDEIIANLKSRGVWDDQKARREKELRERYSKCLSELFLEKGKMNPDKDKVDELRKEKIELDIELALLTETKSYFINSAAETQIEESAMLFKAALCIKDNEDKRVWDNVENLKNETNKALVNVLTSEGIYFWAGVDPSMFDSALE